MRIFIGHDSRHHKASKVCMESIRSHSKAGEHVITLLDKAKLTNIGFYGRKDVKGESTEFSFTRFYSPLINHFKDTVLFCDNDFLWKCNPTELLQYLGDNDVAVVKHDLKEVKGDKMDGIKNKWYPKKCWSSLMLFNAEKCKKLSKEYLDNATPKELHEFDWVDDDKIGEIPVEYNHLVGYYPKHDNIKAIHYTNGGPWFDEYKNSEMAELWWNVYEGL
jgi:hypothetical protein